MTCLLALLTVLLLDPVPDLKAGEIDDADFGLRLTAAISRNQLSDFSSFSASS